MLDDDDDETPVELDEYERRVQFAASRADGDASSFEDHEIEEWWSARVRRIELRDQLHVADRPPNEHDEHDALPLRELAPRHAITFLVLDGNGDAFPGVPYVLHESGIEVERECLGQDGTVRRSNVVHDDWTLRLVEIEAVMWLEPAARVGDTVSLAIRTSGVADGTSLDVLVFEELRETDDEQLATTKAQVAGDAAIATWTIDATALDGRATIGGMISVVAEVRGPFGTWAKTAIALPIETPAIVHTAWGAPLGQPGEPVAMQATTRGLADGTRVAFDVYRVRSSGEDEHVETAAELEVVGGSVATEWTPPCSSSGTTAPAEYWFSASIVDPIVCSMASALLHTE